jgi:hypothetical protein
MGNFKQRFGAASTEIGELVSALLAMAWGFWMLLPWSTFSAAPRVYVTLQWLCNSEVVWGLFYLLVGIAQLVSVIRGNIKPRMILSFIAALSWLLLALCFAFGAIETPGLPIFGLHALAAARVYLKLARGV